MALKLIEALREEYNSLFQAMEIRPERRDEVERVARRISSNMSRYIAVENATRVPWFVVGVIHSLEASLRFDRHLHNGDPLTARTIHEPRGRPESGAPPFSWEESAADALGKLGERASWTLADIAFILEQYNGFGYRTKHPEVKSPYLWSFTSIYSRGKFVADGTFSPFVVSEQCGGMALLRALIDANHVVATRIDLGAPTISDAEDRSAKDFPHTEGRDGDADPPPARPARPYPGRFLQSGLRGDPDVKAAQTRLKQVGADPGIIDGDFDRVTEFAVKLFQARSVGVDGKTLEIDGVIGPETWAALFGSQSLGDGKSGGAPKPPARSLASAVVDFAADEIGVMEQPPGSNRGRRVDEYVGSVDKDLVPSGGAPGVPWCVCFVYFCFQEAARNLGVANPFPRNAGVHVAWKACNALPKDSGVTILRPSEALSDPTRVLAGMTFFIDTGNGHGHVGVVAGNQGGFLDTIEGNTNNGGSREGIGVFRRAKRRVTDINLGFVGFSSP